MWGPADWLYIAVASLPGLLIVSHFINWRDGKSVMVGLLFIPVATGFFYVLAPYVLIFLALAALGCAMGWN
jgi:hypothetical protein